VEGGGEGGLRLEKTGQKREWQGQVRSRMT
jgi:hypothetical protein